MTNDIEDLKNEILEKIEKAVEKMITERDSVRHEVTFEDENNKYVLDMSKPFKNGYIPVKVYSKKYITKIVITGHIGGE